MSYLRRVIEHRVAILHPKDELGQLSDQDAVKYVLGKEGEEGSVRLTCTIMVGDREAVRVGDGLSVMEVQTRAADEACRIMRREGRKIRNDMGYSNEKAGAEVHEEEQVEEEVEEDRDQGMDGTEGTGHDSDEYMTADER